MAQATWNSWIEAPKSANLKSKLTKRCIDLKIDHTITSESLNRRVRSLEVPQNLFRQNLWRK